MISTRIVVTVLQENTEELQKLEHYTQLLNDQYSRQFVDLWNYIKASFDINEFLNDITGRLLEQLENTNKVICGLTLVLDRNTLSEKDLNTLKKWVDQDAPIDFISTISLVDSVHPVKFLTDSSLHPYFNLVSSASNNADAKLDSCLFENISLDTYINEGLAKTDNEKEYFKNHPFQLSSRQSSSSSVSSLEFNSAVEEPIITSFQALPDVGTKTQSNRSYSAPDIFHSWDSTIQLDISLQVSQEIVNSPEDPSTFHLVEQPSLKPSSHFNYVELHKRLRLYAPISTPTKSPCNSSNQSPFVALRASPTSTPGTNYSSPASRLNKRLDDSRAENEVKTVEDIETESCYRTLQFDK